MHATVRQDLILGLTLTAFFCMVYFVLIPLGIEVPHSHDPGQLSPAAYPSWIALAGLGASLLLTANTILKHLRLRRAAAPPASQDKAGPRSWGALLHTLLAFGLLFLFYFFIDDVGMVLGSFILYAAFARLCGERNWLRLLLTDCILTAALYVFFVRIAAVPVPLGILQSFL